MLKGHTRIELTNVHTGKKEVVEKHNIVTNAIQDMLKTYGIYSPAIFKDKVCQNFNIKGCFGGLIAWDGTIEESKENYRFKPYGVNAGAHAACDIVNSETDTLLGSYNSGESEITNNYAKFVYDFATNQGNGVISCITLVSHNNGCSGFNGINTSNDLTGLEPRVQNGFNNMIPFPSENKLISVDKLLQTSSIPSITITEYSALLSNTFSLFKGTTPVKTNEVTLNAASLCDYDNPDLAEGYYSPIYYDDTTKTISVVLYEKNTTVSEVTIATVNVLTREITKQKVSIPSYTGTSMGAVHYKNYLIYGQSESSMSIMDLTTGKVNTKTISLHTANSNGRKQIYPLNEHEFLFWHDYSHISAHPRLLVNLKDGETKELSMDIVAYPSVNYSFLPGHPLYFGTINNLDAPVTKTADKTMKIIYTLTET